MSALTDKDKAIGAWAMMLRHEQDENKKLRAELAAAQRTIEAQAAELNNVRNLIDRQLNIGYISFSDRVGDMRRWLDTHPEAR